jgi:2-polyprenyl-3-methyl-5-hydroxy-6-metoxy-1,4-benzoquinol methylase
MLANREIASTKELEREWHDSFFREHGREDFAPTPEEFQEWFRRVDLTAFCDGGWSYWADPRVEALRKLGDVRGKRVLDYGCGSGKLGIYLSLQGAEVWGFDLSTSGVEVANEVVKRYRTGARFEQMDAEELRYEPNFFDRVVSFGVLHHVIKYPAAADHLYRVLKPGGVAVFSETLWDNPLINFARRFTTPDADAGDTKLTQKGIYEFCRSFPEIHLDKYNLVYMLKRLASLPKRDLAAPIRPRPFWQFVKSVDETLLRFPPLQRYCGEVIISLRK